MSPSLPLTSINLVLQELCDHHAMSPKSLLVLVLAVCRQEETEAKYYADGEDAYEMRKYFTEAAASKRRRGSKAGGDKQRRGSSAAGAAAEAGTGGSSSSSSKPQEADAAAAGAADKVPVAAASS